jgi:phosphatidylglycerol phospholipase C
MPRLKDLLEFLTTPGLEDIWVLLDIKMDDDSDDMMRLIGKTLADVKPTKPWEERVVLGCWAVSSAS